MWTTELSSQTAGGSAPALLERERELEAVERALDRLAQGTGSLLLIEGPAGIGKTRLLAEAAERARRRKLLVRSARGGELERDMPFGVVNQLFEPVVERASGKQRARLLAGSARLALLAFGHDDPDLAPSGAEPLAPIHGLYWLVANLSDDRPVALAIDDAHWADAQSLRFVDYLSRRIADLPVLAVATVRSGEPNVPAELQPLRLAADVIRPTALSASAVRELVAQEVGLEPTEEFVKSCADATAGNPFYIAEVLRALRGGELDAGRARADALARFGPETVARYSLLRIGAFGQEAVALARGIAVLGGAPQMRHAAALAGFEEERTRKLSDRLRDAEILAPGLPIAFVHPLVRQAIYGDVAEGERSAMHRRAAEILVETHADDREIAPHLMACAPNGDQWVVDRLRKAAARAAAAGAHGAAAGYLERALNEPPDDDLPVLIELGRALTWADPFRAPLVLEPAAERASEPGQRLVTLRALGLAYFLTGRMADAREPFAKVLEIVAESDREQRLALEAQIWMVTYADRGLNAAMSAHISDLASGLAGATPAECLVRQVLGSDRFFACAPLDEVVELLASFPPLPWEIAGIASSVPMGALKLLAWSGGWDEARRALAGYLEWGHREGNLLRVSAGNSFLSEADRLAGRLTEAEAEARTAWDIAKELGRLLPTWNALMNLVLALIARGGIAEAKELTQGFDMSWGPREVPANPWPIEIRGYIRLAEGDLEGAVQDLLTLGEELERRRMFNPALPPWRQEATLALAALDRTAEARALIRVAEERARAFGAPHVVGTVLRARAALEPAKRRIATLGESVAAFEVNGPPHELARSLIDLGIALRHDRRVREAREPLRRALDLAHRAGAGGLETRAREELAAAGGRPRTPVRVGLGALTPSELRTARLAAEGLNNPEIAQRLFVTRRTVETHLTRVYEKLEIEGRAELEAALAETRPGVG